MRIFSQLNVATLAAVTAGAKLGKVSLLVAGGSPDAVAQSASQVAGVARVLVAKDAAYAHGLPENVAALVAAVQGKTPFTHIVAAHTAFGKNFMPRLSAQLDVAQVSDVMAINSEDTFVRPIYAGADTRSADRYKGSMWALTEGAGSRGAVRSRQRHRHGQELRCGQGPHRPADLVREGGGLGRQRRRRGRAGRRCYEYACDRAHTHTQRDMKRTRPLTMRPFVDRDRSGHHVRQRRADQVRPADAGCGQPRDRGRARDEER